MYIESLNVDEDEVEQPKVFQCLDEWQKDFRDIGRTSKSFSEEV